MRVEQEVPQTCTGCGIRTNMPIYMSMGVTNNADCSIQAWMKPHKDPELALWGCSV